jgi:hypothetical protein
MIRTFIRLTAIALLTAIGMLVAPGGASALTLSGASIDVSSPSAGATQGMIATTKCRPDMAAMAAAMRAHPEMAKMMARMMVKMMKAHHPGMAAAMHAHPEIAKIMKADCDS